MGEVGKREVEGENLGGGNRRVVGGKWKEVKGVGEGVRRNWGGLRIRGRCGGSGKGGRGKRWWERIGRGNEGGGGGGGGGDGGREMGEGGEGGNGGARSGNGLGGST